MGDMLVSCPKAPPVISQISLVALGKAKLGWFRCIERISAELQIYPIRSQGKDLGEAKVLIEVLWTTEVVATADGESDWTSKVTLYPDWIRKQVDLATGCFMHMGLNTNAVAVEDLRSIV